MKYIEILIWDIYPGDMIYISKDFINNLNDFILNSYKNRILNVKIPNKFNIICNEENICKFLDNKEIQILNANFNSNDIILLKDYIINYINDKRDDNTENKKKIETIIISCINIINTYITAEKINGIILEIYNIKFICDSQYYKDINEILENNNIGIYIFTITLFSKITRLLITKLKRDICNDITRDLYESLYTKKILPSDINHTKNINNYIINKYNLNIKGYYIFSIIILILVIIIFIGLLCLYFYYNDI